MYSLCIVDIISGILYSSHWYVAVICHPGLFEATSSRSILSLNDSSIESSGDIITGILDDPPSTVASSQVTMMFNYSKTLY